MEIELKFALLADASASLAQRLARLPVLLGRKVRHYQLHNTYFDTPDQFLRRNKVALRVRQIGTVAAPQWVQTLKIGRGGDSALSQRGEWEAALPNGNLDPTLLASTPWRELDPDGSLFAALRLQCVTAFARTTWTIGVRGGSRVEVALDIGTVEVNGSCAPICELELELLAGSTDALFVVAKRVAHSVSLMPLHWSKSERGYQLAQGALNKPVRSDAVPLNRAMPLHEVAATALREMLLQFTANLNHLRASDDPEVLHQARVGWRRFKGALQLFRKHPGLAAAPALAPLQTLVHAMARLRDLEVAACETLPMFANAYTGGEAQRKARWKAMEKALNRAVGLQRTVLLSALEHPKVGHTLVELTRWIETQLQEGADANKKNRSLYSVVVSDWLLHRLSRLYRRLQVEPVRSSGADTQHRIRILSKRLRYAVEALRPLLPPRKAKRWLKIATALQENIGAARDIGNAVNIVADLKVDSGIVEFLRGLAFGERMHVC